MEKHMHRVMSDHWIKLSFCLVAILKAQVHGLHYVNITFLESAVNGGAVCLNGSPPAYHYAKGFGKGANRWMVYLEGGGWCGSEDGCLFKVQNIAIGPGCGSSYNMSKTIFFSGILSESQTINPDFYNWNRVFVRYCDGSLFSGDQEELSPKFHLYRRGARIFKAVIRELLAQGMGDASHAILVGNSAGGLATILNCDRFDALFTNAYKVKCIADAGFFIRGKELPGAFTRRESPFAGIVEFHGIAKFLPESCTSKMDPGLCLFPENLVEDVRTPLFLLNSAFDSFQIRSMLEPVEPGWRNCTFNDLLSCTPAQIQAMKDFRNALIQALPERDSSRRGMFIEPCFYHDHLYFDDRWTGITLRNTTMAKAIGDWYYDRNSFREITMIDYPLNCTKLTSL